MEHALIGRKVEFSEPKGLRRPCDYCGSFAFKIERGTETHAAHVRCDGCGRRGRWLSKKSLAAMERGLANG